MVTEMGMGMETTLPNSRSSKKQQAGHRDLPDLFKPVKIGIGFAQLKAQRLI